MNLGLALWIIRVSLSPLSTFCSICVAITFLWNAKKLFPCVHVSFIFFQALCDAVYNIHHLEAVINPQNNSQSDIPCTLLGSLVCLFEDK